jgi:hypothetical protein
VNWPLRIAATSSKARCLRSSAAIAPSAAATAQVALPRLEFKAAAPGPIQTVLETSPPDKDPVTQTASGGDFMRLLSASLRTSAVKVGRLAVARDRDREVGIRKATEVLARNSAFEGRTQVWHDTNGWPRAGRHLGR